jgi:hypothetical protein
MSKLGQAKKQPSQQGVAADQLTVTKTVEPPPIEDTLAKTNQILAKKVIHKHHRCRECDKVHCPHYLRVDNDTGELFEFAINEVEPGTGRRYVDANNSRK